MPLKTLLLETTEINEYINEIGKDHFPDNFKKTLIQFEDIKILDH